MKASFDPCPDPDISRHGIKCRGIPLRQTMLKWQRMTFPRDGGTVCALLGKEQRLSRVIPLHFVTTHRIQWARYRSSFEIN